MSLIDKKNIQIIDGPSTKPELFEYLADFMIESGQIGSEDRKAFIEGLWFRENEVTTGVGNGIGVPHIKDDILQEPVMVFLKSKKPIDYDSLDHEPVTLVFMIAVPNHAGQVHLDLLAAISRKLMDEVFVEQLKDADTTEELFHLLNTVPSQKLEENKMSSKKLLAVTSCTNGIAHTYMAAENIEKAAKKLGYQIKVETDGSGGAQNELTAQEIKDADAIIVAADVKVNTARFNGKKVLFASVTEGIKEAEKLVKNAVNAPVHVESEEITVTAQKTGIYSHLMSGVSNMLPFVVGGGILIAISFMWGINSATVGNEQYNQIAAYIKSIGDASFSLMIPILAGYISYSIADRPGLAPGMVGGLLAYNGGAGFLGALISGFLAGYLVNGLKKLCKGMPKSLEGMKPMLIYPLISIFIVGMIVVVIINPVMSQVNVWITNFLDNLGSANRLILGFLLGAMLAVDLGGPINKAAYTFGVAMLQAGNYEIMGAVMVSGMVIAPGVSLATYIAPKLFNKEERAAANANWILGLSFICEGAIPYAASDPKAVIPALSLGAGITGALTMLIGVGVPAPHGGIFVLPIVQNIGGFLICLAAGIVITALLVVLFKKLLPEKNGATVDVKEEAIEVAK